MTARITITRRRIGLMLLKEDDDDGVESFDIGSAPPSKGERGDGYSRLPSFCFISFESLDILADIILNNLSLFSFPGNGGNFLLFLSEKG